MSTWYFINCDDCQKIISAADRSFRGVRLTPEAREKLARFTVEHCSHNIRIISEHGLTTPIEEEDE